MPLPTKNFLIQYTQGGLGSCYNCEGSTSDSSGDTSSETVDLSGLVTKDTTLISTRTGDKYVKSSQTLDFGMYFRKNTRVVTVYKNDTELTYDTDYSWSDFPKMSDASPVQLDYTTKILLADEPSSDDVFRIEYTESVIPNIFIPMRAVCWNTSNSELQTMRPTMITKHLHQNGNNYHLSDHSEEDNGVHTCTYTNDDDSNDTITIKKTFANSIYTPTSTVNSDLDFEIELWRENRNSSYSYKYNHDKAPMEAYGHLTPVYCTDKNLVMFNTSATKHRTRYFIRFRFTDDDNRVYYSDFMPYKARLKYFNIFTIENSGLGTVENYAGVYETLQLVY